MKENKIKETKSFIANQKDYIIINDHKLKSRFKKPTNITKSQNLPFKNLKLKKFIYIILFLFILFFLFLYLYKYSFKRNQLVTPQYKIITNQTTEKDFIEQLNNIQNYMNLVFNGTQIDNGKIYYPSKNPKVSVVVSVYNAEGFLKNALLSIQNQDLKDIEIIMVDDCSKDNSVNVIKEMMKTEPRIFLYQNKENKGALYTKSKGILLSKGKYLLILDVDDMFVQRNAFSFLYEESEKYNLDVLSFFPRASGSRLPRHISSFGDKKNKIITQPELGYSMYFFDSKGRVKQKGGVIVDRFYRTEMIQKAVKLIDEKNMNNRMIFHDDFIILFLVTRTAKRMKYYDKIFYVWLHIYRNSDPKIKFRNEIKRQNVNDDKCLSFVNFLEIIFKNTKNTFDDKKIAFSQLEKWYLNTHCRNNKISREKAIEVFKLYLASEYISNEDKRKIQNFIDTPNNIL